LEGHNVTHPLLLLLLLLLLEMLLEHENTTKSACRKSVSHVLCLLLAIFLSFLMEGGFCMLPSSFQETTFQLIARHHPNTLLTLPEGFIIIIIIIIT
jgi:hypothetical protein